jgi:hypothetical protein
MGNSASIRNKILLTGNLFSLPNTTKQDCAVAMFKDSICELSGSYRRHNTLYSVTGFSWVSPSLRANEGQNTR